MYTKIKFPDYSGLPLDRLTALMYCEAVARELTSKNWYWSVEDNIPTLSILKESYREED